MALLTITASAPPHTHTSVLRVACLQTKTHWGPGSTTDLAAAWSFQGPVPRRRQTGSVISSLLGVAPRSGEVRPAIM